MKKKNPFVTNKGGIIKAPDTTVGKDGPKAKVTKGNDLRCGKGKGK